MQEGWFKHVPSIQILRYSRCATAQTSWPCCQNASCKHILHGFVCNCMYSSTGATCAPCLEASLWQKGLSLTVSTCVWKTSLFLIESQKSVCLILSHSDQGKSMIHCDSDCCSYFHSNCKRNGSNGIPSSFHIFHLTRAPDQRRSWRLPEVLTDSKGTIEISLPWRDDQHQNQLCQLCQPRL